MERKKFGWPFPKAGEMFKNQDRRWVEINEEDYWYFLECLPPLIQNSNGFLNSEPYTESNDGTVYIGCIKFHERYFCRLMSKNEFKNIKPPTDAEICVE